MADNVVEPNPTEGIEASSGYAEHYAATHRAQPTFEYRRGYLWLLVLDALLRDYVLLDVGCGTGGYWRLARNHQRIVGLDFSKAMIEKGRELRDELGIRNTELIYGRFESYLPNEQFDAVNLSGVIGRYAPWPGNEALLEKIHKILRPGGIAVFALVIPRSIVQFFKAVLFPTRTVVIRKAHFRRMVQRAGFELLFCVDTEGADNTHIFCRRNSN